MAMYKASTGNAKNTQALDKRHLLSQGNGVFFDSEAFAKMPSHMHQLQSQGNLTTLNQGPVQSTEYVMSTVTTQQNNFDEDRQRAPAMSQVNDEYD